MFCTILEFLFIFVLALKPRNIYIGKCLPLIPNLLSPGHPWTINILIQSPILARTQSEDLLIRMMEDGMVLNPN